MKKLRKLSAVILATIMALSVYSPTNATESVLQEAGDKGTVLLSPFFRDTRME